MRGREAPRPRPVNPGRGLKESVEAATAPAAFFLTLTVLAWVMVALPGMVVYTVTSGKRAVATIEKCETRTPLRDTEYVDCRGTWQFADGTRDSGHVSGVGKADIGRRVPVRVGPLGPYAGDLDRSRHTLYPAAFMWVTTLPVLGVFTYFFLRSRARGRRIIARSGTGTSLTGLRKWRDQSGRTVLRFRTSSRPPAPLERETGDTAPRLVTRRPYVTARTASGEIAFFLVRQAGGIGVFDTTGRPAVTAERVTHSPLRLRLLTPDRKPLGAIGPHPASRDLPGVAYQVVTATGEPVATIVARFLRYTVVFPAAPPDHLRQAVMAFAFDALRFTR